MAVLVRTNGQLVGFEAAFRAAGVPFQLRGERFFNRPEIRARAGRVRGDRHPPPVAEGEPRRSRPSSPAPGRGRSTSSPTRCRPARRPASATARCSRCSRSAASSRSPTPKPDRGVPRRGGPPDRRRGRGHDRLGWSSSPTTAPRASSGTPSSSRARGRDPADPPGQRARRDRGGAPAPLRRDHPRPGPPVALVGPPAGRPVDRSAALAVPARGPAVAGPFSRGRGRSGPAGP